MGIWWPGSTGSPAWKRYETLKVIPNAKKSEAVGWEEDPRAGRALKLRIAAPPVEGKANKVVVLFLSAWLDIPRSSISLLRGESSRLKVVELPDGCEGKLARLLSAEDISGAEGRHFLYA